MWRLLSRGSGIWKEILCGRYGVNIVELGRRGLGGPLRYASAGWKGVSILSTCLGVVANKDLRSMGVARIARDNTQTYFCEDVWFGEAPFRESFPRHFQVSTHKSSYAGSTSLWMDDRWVGDMKWRKNLFVWEKELVVQLLDVWQTRGLLCFFHTRVLDRDRPKCGWQSVCFC